MFEILDFDKSDTHRIIRVILAMAVKNCVKKYMGPTAYIAPNQHPVLRDKQDYSTEQNFFAIFQLFNL